MPGPDYAGVSPTSSTWRWICERHASQFGSSPPAAPSPENVKRLLADPQRFERFHVRIGDDLIFDYSRHWVTQETIAGMMAVVRESGVAARFRDMSRGMPINRTENRRVLHMALRESSVAKANGLEETVAGTRDRILAFATAFRSGAVLGATGKPLNHVVNIGIGGSDLGPAMVCRALRTHCRGFPAAFVSNVDGHHLQAVLDDRPPEHTLFVVTSKTFTTRETLLNAASARAWLKANLPQSAAAALDRHFIAVTASVDRAATFGARETFPLWDWVGGRYSLWSAVGLPIALSAGPDAFVALLDGAAAIDRHVAASIETSPESCVPVLMATIGALYVNLYDAASHAILPYDQDLELLPAYLQQLEMESNGKGVASDAAGTALAIDTGPVIWGAPGTNGQHSFHQLLHQGTRQNIPCDFIGFARPRHALPEHHRVLLANFVAQPGALAFGTPPPPADAADGERFGSERICRGGRPTSVLLFPELSPRTLGMLIALYEHKVFVQGVLWNINSFDQFGVELGKTLATLLEPALGAGGADDARDPCTAGLLKAINAWWKN